MGGARASQRTTLEVEGELPTAATTLPLGPTNAASLGGMGVGAQGSRARKYH